MGSMECTLFFIEVTQIPSHIRYKLHASQTSSKLLLWTDLLCADKDIDEEENASAPNNM